MSVVEWQSWDILNPLCPLGHDNCDQISLSNTYVFCYTCLRKYFKEDYEEKKEVKSGCDANDDGIPPNNKLLGILPTIL